ncbi:uncharacterized protein LOC142765292 isoform X2 [Rhipicephalus microplus]
MPTALEQVCCDDTPQVVRDGPDCCITLHEEFQSKCLSSAVLHALYCELQQNAVAIEGEVHREKVGPLVVVEDTLRDGLDTNRLEASNGGSHPTARVEHASSQKEVAGSSSTTPNKWLASPVELVLSLTHPVYDDYSSHDAEVLVANCLATYRAVSE